MDAILHGLSGIFEIICIVGLGFFLNRKGFFWKTASDDLTKMTMYVALPPFMIYSLCHSFTRKDLIAMAPDLVLPFASIFMAYILGRILASILKIRQGRRGVFVTTCCIANCIFIGLPVNLALFGDKSVPYVMLYYIANTVMFWTLGAYLIIKDAGAKDNLTPAMIFKKMLTPPLLGFIAGVLLVLIDVPIPHFLMESFRYVGNMATAMALIVIGIQVSEIPFSEIVIDKDLVGAMFGRFFLGPLGLIILFPLFPVNQLEGQVFVLQAAMPAMTNMTILASSVGADAKYCAMINCLSLLLGVFFIPFYMWVVSVLLV